MRILLTAFLFTITSFNIHAEGFLAGFEDIPLIDGAKQIENDIFTFGNEEIRYIETRVSFSAQTTFDDVKKFYENTLTQLGWNEQRNLADTISFMRENDILEISMMANSPLKISIILKSKS